MCSNIMFFLIGFGTFILVLAIASYWSRNTLEERLERIKQREKLNERIINLARELGGFLSGFPLLREVVNTEALQSKLRIAGFRIQTTEFMGIWGLSILASFAIAFLLRPFLPAIILPFVAFIGVVAPKAHLDRKYRKMKIFFGREFIEFVERVQVGLSGGLGFYKVLEWAAKTKMSFSSEIHQVLQDAKLGDPIDESLDRFAKRMDDPEVDHFVQTIKYSARNGTLGSVDNLSGLVVDMRRRKSDKIDENARKAELKILLPIILTIFPATGILVVGPMLINLAKIFIGS